MMIKLFTAQTANGNSAPVPTTSFVEFTRPVTIVASGAFDSATLTLQVSPDDGTTWVSTASALTAAGILVVSPIDSRLAYRLAVASAGAATSISAWVTGR